MNYIQEICNQIVVPPKIRYSMMDLGYPISTYGKRQDFNVKNKDSQILKASLYVPKQLNHSQICVIYLHSMNGSRLQCLGYVQNILQKGFYLCSFDFSGCGNSQGTCISFGANQKHDIQVIVEQLVLRYNVTRFILWGRSMGAVSSIKYCQMMINNFSMAEIYGIILDSPFQSLKKLIIQLGAKRSDLPKFFISAFYHVIKSTLQRKGSFDIEDLQLIKSIKKIEGIPICFLVSKDDTTIDASHSQQLFAAYRFWNKRLVYFTGLHNQSRDVDYIKSVNTFLDERAMNASEVKGKKNLRYKRVLLQQQILRKNISQGKQYQDQCQCNIFSVRRT